MRNALAGQRWIAARVGIGAAAALLAAGTSLAGDGWKDSLKRELESTYTLTKRATLSNRITRQGTVLVVRKDGITADLESDLRYSVTKVTDGAVGEEGGAVAAIFAKERSRVFRKDERVFVTDIDVDDDGVMFKVLSCDTSDISEKGSSRPMRYKGAVKFMYAGDSGPARRAADVKVIVDPVMIPESEASATQTKTIALGQSRGEVEEILGKPERIVDLGPKVTYVYKDMKVVFSEGKVADVQ